MIPHLSELRYIGHEGFNVGIAESIVKTFFLGLPRTLGATVSAEYKKLGAQFYPYVNIMYREADHQLCPETVQAMTKYWVKRAWGHDLLVKPSNNAPFVWKVTEKSFKYQNRDGILPSAEAPLGQGQFPEYRPYGSIPGTWRLFKGKTKWWVTNHGTHGGTAACRGANWWVWPTNLCNWHDWTITGASRASGCGSMGTAVALAEGAKLPDLSKHEKWAIRLMIANYEQAEQKKDWFGSKTLWSDAGMMASDELLN